jgi:hypothetical protein
MGRILRTAASLVIGLTLAATAAVSTIPAEAATRWRAAGVKLPHSAGKQYRIGKKISKSQLRNGDLVFFYPAALAMWGCTPATARSSMHRVQARRCPTSR